MIVLVLLWLGQFIAGSYLTGNVTTTITVPTTVATYDAGSSATLATLSGTAVSDRPIMACTWTNNLGGGGSATGSNVWSASSIALTVGSNVLSVTCVNDQGRAATAVLTVTRSAGSAENPIAAARLPGGTATLPNPTWSGAGVVGGIPSGTWANCTTAACVTLCPNVTTNNTPSCASGSVTEATIESAVASAITDTVVWMPAGVYTVGGLSIGDSNVVLRGQGASVTILRINSGTDVSCHIGAGQLVQLCANGANIGIDSPDNTATWTASNYNAGQTTITLSSRTNLVVGSPIWLDQADDFAGSHTVNWAADGYPGVGDVVVESWGSANFMRDDRGLLEGHLVTACGTTTPGAACTSNTITIDPGLMMPTWRAAQTPGAWWASASSRVDRVGVEDFTIDGNGSTSVHLMLINATNAWARGMRIVNPSSVSTETRLTNFVNCIHCEIRDSYFYGPLASGVVSIYGSTPAIFSLSRFENNIITASINPLVTDSAAWGNVFGYNIVEGQSIGTEQGSFIQHAIGGMNLFEGNQFQNLVFDNIHAPSYFETMHRNHLDGGTRNTIPGEEQSAFMLYAAHHFFNATGNVAGASNWTTYQNGQSPPSRCDACIWGTGWQGTSGSAATSGGNDVRTRNTLFRWGNWDAVTSTDDNGSNDTTGLKWDSGEVPTGITNYANSVPSSNTVPTSFYLSAKPPWFQSLTYPPIGPDVSSSTISTRTGGHANKIPAKVCFDTLANDSTNYGSSSPPIKAFNRVTCYGS